MRKGLLKKEILAAVWFCSTPVQKRSGIPPFPPVSVVSRSTWWTSRGRSAHHQPRRRADHLVRQHIPWPLLIVHPWRDRLD